MKRQVRAPQGSVRYVDRKPMWRDWFGLSAGQADVLDALFVAAGDTRDREQLARRLTTARERVELLVAPLFTALDPGGIKHVSTGWKLTPQGLAECRAVLAQEMAA